MAPGEREKYQNVWKKIMRRRKKLAEEDNALQEKLKKMGRWTHPDIGLFKGGATP